MNCFLQNEKKRRAGMLFKGLTPVMLLPAMFLSVVLLSGCSREEAALLRKTDTAMGTMVSQSIYVREESDDSPAEAVMDIISSLEEDTLSWRLETSEIYRINSREETVLSPELSEILQTCLTVSEKSGGAFDVTIGALARLWNMDAWATDREKVQLPKKEQVLEALSLCGYEKLSEGNFSRKEEAPASLSLPDGMQLDLGAVGKGMALDEIARLLAGREEVTGAVISVGGSILTYGEKPDKSSFKVAIVNPSDTASNIGYLKLQGQWCISTSGDYERFVETDGKKYHHILDPHTGFPSESGVSSVTILSKNGLLSDALSTACFVLGAEEGIALAEEFGTEALFVDNGGNISMTEGMEQYFYLY